jgi:hypothetical protein
MRTLGFLGIALLLLSSCGDSGETAQARSAAQVCDEICGWPDECFVQLGVPIQGADCVPNCQSQAELVGLACLSAISDTVACLGTCELESITEQQALACQSVALGIESACE